LQLVDDGGVRRPIDFNDEPPMPHRSHVAQVARRPLACERAPPAQPIGKKAAADAGFAYIGYAGGPVGAGIATAYFIVDVGNSIGNGGPSGSQGRSSIGNVYAGSGGSPSIGFGGNF